jgi:acylphosphatase
LAAGAPDGRIAGEKEDPMQRHYIVHGRVQGVFFRDSTRQKARRLGLRGWVRNCWDGTVEIMAAGMESALDSLERWVRDGGPPAAHVERVDRADVPEEDFGDFQVR